MIGNGKIIFSAFLYLFKPTAYPLHEGGSPVYPIVPRVLALTYPDWPQFDPAATLHAT
jgi:hypothetical protein